MARRRTFLGINVGDPIRAQLIALQEELSAIASDVKWVEPENLHITLLFLGEVGARFPNRRRPRTLWVGVGAGLSEVTAVHDAIEAPLLDMGSYRRETRGYV